MPAAPVVYLFYGDDHAAMRAEVNAMQSKLGDAATADLNTTRFEAAPSLDALRSAAFAAPFLSASRLVVVNGASKGFAAAEAHAQFVKLLEDLPATTLLVLLEPPLEDKKKQNWLLKWAEAAGPNAQVRAFDLPQGPKMAAWIQERTKALKGELQPRAAAALADLVGSDKDAAEHEIEKLLAFTGYQRPIEAADVAAVSLPIGEQGDFFALIDALSSGQGARAMEMLQDLLPERDAILLFFSLVGHFRLLLQCREMVGTGKNEKHIASHFHMHPYRAEKLAAQSRRFSLEALERIYHRLLVLDEQIKTGEMEADLAMETFVASLNAQAA